MAMHETTDFQQYNARFDALVGPLEPGQYGHFRGRLVRRLDAGRFGAKLAEYEELGRRFAASFSAGDTIDDALAVELRAAEIELVLERSLFLPDLGPVAP